MMFRTFRRMFTAQLVSLEPVEKGQFVLSPKAYLFEHEKYENDFFSWCKVQYLFML